MLFIYTDTDGYEPKAQTPWSKLGLGTWLKDTQRGDKAGLISQ